MILHRLGRVFVGLLRSFGLALFINFFYLAGEFLFVVQPSNFLDLVNHHRWSECYLTVLCLVLIAWRAHEGQMLRRTVTPFLKHAHDNYLQQQSFTRLKNQMLVDKISALQRSLVLTSHYMKGLSRSPHAPPEQRQAWTHTAHDLNRLHVILQNLSFDRAELLAQSASQMVAVRNLLETLKSNGVELQDKLFNNVDVILNGSLLTDHLHALIEGHQIQNTKSSQLITCEEARGSLLHHDLEKDGAYCHLQIEQIFTLLQKKWYLRKLQNLFNWDWRDGTIHEAEHALSSLAEICSWHGGIAWTEWASEDRWVIHLALPIAPTQTARMGVTA